MSFGHHARIAVAGILAVPALATLLVAAPLVIILSVPSIAILIRRKGCFWSSSAHCRNGDSAGNSAGNSAGGSAPCSSLLHHAVVSGGSSGIGLAVAVNLAQRQCQHVTLLARNKEQLAEAKARVEREAAKAAKDASGAKPATKVHTMSVDVTDFTSLEKAAAKLCKKQADDKDGSPQESLLPQCPPTLLFNCAGYATPLSFADLSPQSFKAQVDVNYLGSIHLVKAFLPHMTQAPRGNIVLTSSVAGQVGTYGYSAYSPTKFALRGFAECLSMELTAQHANVNISLAYPPDTDTPGYQVENRSKPKACSVISENNGIWDPNVVGQKMVSHALSPNPPFDIYFGIDGWMVSTLTAGMSPVTTLFDALYQVALMGLLRFVSLFYLMDFARLTQKYHVPNNSNNKGDYKSFDEREAKIIEK